MVIMGLGIKPMVEATALKRSAQFSLTEDWSKWVALSPNIQSDEINVP